MNNLYGGAQKRHLPYRKYQWVTEKIEPDQLQRLRQYYRTKHNVLKNGGEWNETLNSEDWFPNDNSHDWLEVAHPSFGGEKEIDPSKDEKWEFYLEVDIKFKDKATAQLMDSFPPAPINTNIVVTDISKKSSELLGKYKGGVPDNYQSTKLLTHVAPRRYYILHSENAELYTSLGMEIIKVGKFAS